MNVDANKIINDGLASFPDIQIVLEISARAREVEQMTPPLNLSMATEIVSSGYPGQQGIQTSTQSTWS